MGAETFASELRIKGCNRNKPRALDTDQILNHNRINIKPNLREA